jgi:hypothetical protein
MWLRDVASVNPAGVAVPGVDAGKKGGGATSRVPRPRSATPPPIVAVRLPGIRMRVGRPPAVSASYRRMTIRLVACADPATNRAK